MRKDTMKKISLQPYREAKINKFMMFHGFLLILVLFVIAFVTMPIVTLA